MGATGDVLVKEYEASTAETFRPFLEVILARYAGKQIYMVLDNAKIPHAKILQPFLEEHPTLHRVFLPPYPPISITQSVSGRGSAKKSS